MTDIINFFGGPGTGKSTKMHVLVGALKTRGIEAEAAPEYAKEMVWQESQPDVLNNQIHVFGEQQNRIHRLLGEVDVVVTDAPLLHSVAYDIHHDFDGPDEAFHELVYDQHSRLQNTNFLLRRPQDYETEGRLQNREEAEAVDGVVQDVLTQYSVPYTPLLTTATVDTILDVVREQTDVL